MANPRPLQGKVICITGAARGIGQATAQYLAARGATLSLADLAFEKGRAVVAGEVGSDGSPGSQSMKMNVDVCDPETVKAWIEATVEKFGRLDGCVNNAGVLPRKFASIAEVELEDWNQVINVNLTGCFTCLKYELQHIKDEGSIVNISSTAGLRGAPNMSAYVASKHGVVGLTKAAAHEGSARKIRVNAICPAPTRTAMNDRLAEEGFYPEGKVLPNLLISKTGEPEEVAAAIAFFLSDETKFHTAVIHSVDGGLLT